MDYEDYYYESRSRYYDACSEVNNYENRANELRSQRQRKIIYINQLKSDLKRHQKVLSELNAALKKDSILQDDIKSINNKIDSASENFGKMASSSSVANKSFRINEKSEYFKQYFLKSQEQEKYGK